MEYYPNPNPQGDSNRWLIVILILVIVLTLFLGGAFMYIIMTRNSSDSVVQTRVDTVKVIERVETAPKSDTPESGTTTHVVEAPEPPSNPGAFAFSGKVGGVSITGELNVSGGYVSGKYYYASTRRKYGNGPSTYMYLNGTVDEGGYIDMTGSDYDGVQCESWSGRLHRGKFSGSLYSYKSGRYFNVSLSRR